MPQGGDGPPVLLRPLPMTQTQAYYYAEALKFSAGVSVVCQQMGPLDQYDARLAGVFWNVVGVPVEPTLEFPSYPVLKLTIDTGAVVQIQVWLWQICLMDAPMWAELCWHPAEGSTVNFVNLSVDASTRRRQLSRLDPALKHTIYLSRAGRRVGSGLLAERPAEDVLAELEELVRAEWKDSPRPRIKRVLKLFSVAVSERTMRRFVWDHRGLTWEIFVDQLRPR